LSFRFLFLNFLVPILLVFLILDANLSKHFYNNKKKRKARYEPSPFRYEIGIK